MKFQFRLIHIGLFITYLCTVIAAMKGFDNLFTWLIGASDNLHLQKWIMLFLLANVVTFHAGQFLLVFLTITDYISKELSGKTHGWMGTMYLQGYFDGIFPPCPEHMRLKK